MLTPWTSDWCWPRHHRQERQLLLFPNGLQSKQPATLCSVGFIKGWYHNQRASIILCWWKISCSTVSICEGEPMQLGPCKHCWLKREAGFAQMKSYFIVLAVQCFLLWILYGGHWWETQRSTHFIPISIGPSTLLCPRSPHFRYLILLLQDIGQRVVHFLLPRSLRISSTQATFASTQRWWPDVLLRSLFIESS